VDCVEWPGFSDKGTVILPVEMNEIVLPKIINHLVKGKFQQKKEFHITLLGKNLGQVVRNKIEQEPGIEKKLRKAFRAIDWSLQLTGPVHLLSRIKPSKRKGRIQAITQKSLVILIKMQGMGQFYTVLKSLKLIPGEVPVPPPHITLYTHNCPYGIGICSTQLLQELTQEVFPIKAFVR
jgi:hypothetical protein